MKKRKYIAVRAVGVLSLVLVGSAHLRAQPVPVDGFLPFVGIGITDQFNDDFVFFPEPSDGVSGNLLGAGGTPNYDLALLDTGAGFSLVTDAAFDEFGLGESSPGEPDGYHGTESVTIGGATGQLIAPINDPFGLYASGVQDRTAAGTALAMNNALLQGQTNTSTITLPPESDLPNIVGLPFASQYATRISSDQPQVFELEGKTVRTPAIDFLPLGSGGGDIVRKAPLNLNPGATFTSPPGYLINIANFDIDKPQENPSLPTAMQGGLFLNVAAENGSATLGDDAEFFFDTGASVTVLSEFTALQLGFDVTIDEPEFTISIVGSGGAIDNVPGFFLDQFSVKALGGDLTATNVPVIVLDVTDPSDAGNIVSGIVGTNLLAGRNVVIDPNPSIGAGGESAGVYISDRVTSDSSWDATTASASWSNPGAWDTAAMPDLLSLADVRHVTGGNQAAVVSGNQEAWSFTVGGGTAGQTMAIRIPANSKLTTFSGATVEPGGVVALEGGTLDVQYLDIRGGRLTGNGLIKTGSGPITGQVEAVVGTIAPGDGVGRLTIEGRLSLGEGGELEIGLAGLAAGTEHDQLIVDGPAALSGTLSVTLDVANYTPATGDTFDLILYDEAAGQFDSLDLPTDYQWVVSYDDDALRLIVSEPGDFNGDGIVNAADYNVWRNGLGTTYEQADYMTWANNYGAVLTLGSPTTSVPEPTTMILLAISILLPLAARR